MKSVLLSLLMLAGSSALILLHAQDGVNANVNPNPDPDGQYEPGRAVARISILNGDVSVRRGDSGDVIAAAVNGPLMADDRLLTSSTGRAEVELDSGNMIRIGPNSEVRFTGMDVRSFQVQVATGTLTFRTLRPSQAQVEVDTPSVAVRPMRPGAYRVTVHEDGTSEITIRSGEAEVDSQRGGERLQAGQTMQARGPASDAEFQVMRPIPIDAFDRWNDDRDRFILSSQSYQHVSPAISGAEDLDQNGRWVSDPNYGAVWQPTDVGPDWAPYQNGRWVWEDYYGWTWVSADPWGWAPYHYGRWFMGAGGWAWYPGPVLGAPFWAPAYVGFFGYGPGLGIGVGFGFGGVGWVALAPFEAVHPWWGRGLYAGYRGGVYANHTTIINNSSVMSSYRNARVAGGAIGVNAAGFGRGGQISSLNRTQIQSAGLVHGVLPVSPDRSSQRMSDRAVSGRYAQSSAQNFASRMQTPRAEHASFDQQQRGMQQMSRGNFSTGSEAGRGFSRFGTASSYGRSASPYARGVRISPSIVAPRSNAAPRSNQTSRPAYSSGSHSTGAGHSGGGSHGGGHR